MLAMGVHPKVGSATSSCMILFTSFTATTSFMVFGLLIPDYAFVGLIVGFFATTVGQIGLTYLMKKFQRNSFIAFSIGGVVLLSAFLMTIQSLVSLAEKEHHLSHKFHLSVGDALSQPGLLGIELSLRKIGRASCRERVLMPV